MPRHLLLLTLLVALVSPAAASDLKSLVGDEPLRSDFNRDRGSVRLIFLGAPT